MAGQRGRDSAAGTARPGALRYSAAMLPPLYHLLDPIWPRLPLPVRPRWETARVGPLQAIRCWREVFGQERLSVYAYAVDGVMVDSGLASLGEPVLAFARAQGVERAVITHYHEDHSGNAARLIREGFPVESTRQTSEILASGFPIKLYEHLFWGPAPAARPAVLGDQVQFGRHTARVIPAPGHCTDQVCFYVPSEGWLFSGDAFIHERVRIFREDEDFTQTLATLDRLCALDFDHLFCAHRPRIPGATAGATGAAGGSDGKAALIKKRAWLLEIQGAVLQAHGEGRPVREIQAILQQKLSIGTDREMRRVTAGDATTSNMIRAILYGPRPRPAIARILGRLTAQGC